MTGLSVQLKSPPIRMTPSLRLELWSLREVIAQNNGNLVVLGDESVVNMVSGIVEVDFSVKNKTVENGGRRNYVYFVSFN